MRDLAANVAFVKHVEDAGEQLADATWPPSEYDYAVVELPATLGAARAARDWATAASVTGSLKEAELDDASRGGRHCVWTEIER